MANEELRIRNLNRVLQTAYEQFLCNGIENTTQLMLVKASGLSRASIDRYFANKADCVVQTAELIANHIYERLEFLCSITAGKELTGIEILEKYMLLIKGIYCENPRQFILIAEIKTFIYRNYPDCTAVFRRISSALGDRTLLKNIFELGIEDGSILSDIPVDEEVILLSEFYRELLVNLSFSQNPSSVRVTRFIDRYIERTLNTYRVKHA